MILKKKCSCFESFSFLNRKCTNMETLARDWTGAPRLNCIKFVPLVKYFKAAPLVKYFKLAPLVKYFKLAPVLKYFKVVPLVNDTGQRFERALSGYMVKWCNLSRKRNSKQPDGFDRFQLHPTPHYQSIRTIQKIHNSI